MYFQFCDSYFLSCSIGNLDTFENVENVWEKEVKAKAPKAKVNFFSFFYVHFFLNLCTLFLFGSSWSCIYRERVSQQPGDRRKRDQRRNCKRRWKPGQEACGLWRVVCSPPPPPPPIHLDKGVSVPLPLSFLPPTTWSYPLRKYRDLSSGSLWWPRGRVCINWYWTVMVITFRFHQFFAGRLWADI